MTEDEAKRAELEARAKMWQAIADLINVVAVGGANLLAEALKQQQDKGRRG